MFAFMTTAYKSNDVVRLVAILNDFYAASIALRLI